MGILFWQLVKFLGRCWATTTKSLHELRYKIFLSIVGGDSESTSEVMRRPLCSFIKFEKIYFSFFEKISKHGTIFSTFSKTGTILSLYLKKKVFRNKVQFSNKSEKTRQNMGHSPRNNLPTKHLLRQYRFYPYGSIRPAFPFPVEPDCACDFEIVTLPHKPYIARKHQ